MFKEGKIAVHKYIHDENLDLKKKLDSENRITEITENVMMSLLFVDGITTFILVEIYSFPEQNFVLNTLHYLVSEWTLAIILWLVIIYLTFTLLRKTLGYNLRREYRAVVIMYALNLLIAVYGNLFILVKELLKI